MLVVMPVIFTIERHAFILLRPAEVAVVGKLCNRVIEKKPADKLQER